MPHDEESCPVCRMQRHVVGMAMANLKGKKMSYDTELEAMRVRHDPAERPEPQEPSMDSEERQDAIESAGNAAMEMYPEGFDDIFNHRDTVDADFCRDYYNEQLAAELAKRAK
jgi:hypothetical protein